MIAFGERDFVCLRGRKTMSHERTPTCCARDTVRLMPTSRKDARQITKSRYTTWLHGEGRRDVQWCNNGEVGSRRDVHDIRMYMYVHCVYTCIVYTCAHLCVHVCTYDRAYLCRNRSSRLLRLSASFAKIKLESIAQPICFIREESMRDLF